MSLPHGFRANANRIALGLRVQLNLRPEAPIDLAPLCSRLGLTLVPLTSFEIECPEQVRQLGVSDREAFSALLLPLRPGLKIILYNDTHIQERQNSSIAHEISHVLLAHPAPVLFDGAGRRYADQGIEDEANSLAGHILIPNEAAWHIVKSRMEDRTACQLYGVSPTMLSFRLNTSGARKRLARLKVLKSAS